MFTSGQFGAPARARTPSGQRSAPSTGRSWRLARSRQAPALALALRLIGIGLVVLLATVGLAPTAARAQEGPDGGNGGNGGSGGDGAAEPTVEQAVVDAVAEGPSDFWVVLRDRADLSGARDIEDWAERGQHVYDQLTATATASQEDLVADLQARGVAHESFWIVNAVYVRDGDPSVLDLVRNHPEVASVLAPQTYEIPDPVDAPDQPGVDAVEWGIANIRADQVWSELGVQGEGIVVANIDTGVEFTHPALVDQYRGSNGDGTFDHNYNWFDPAGDDCASEPCDFHGHGTHTMGTMVGSDGGDNQIGVAPGARWMSALGCPFGSCPDFDLISSGEFVMAPTDLSGQNPRPDLRAHIVNNSWGLSNFSDESPFYSAVVDAWSAAGIFGVFSAGNDGFAGCDTIGSPADDLDAWAVGAYDINNFIAGFSSRGPAGDPADEYVKPNMAAPGVDVRSSLPGASYGNFDGTSMAAPHVSGAVALMWSASPASFGDVTATREIFNETSVDMDDTSCGGTADNNNVWGEGRLDAFAAVDATPRGPTGTLVGTVTDVTTGDPIAGATVTATVEGRPRTARTGPDGTYRLRLPVGTYQVEATATGYRTVTQQAEILEDQETTLDFALPAAPRLSGTVTNANDGLPVEGASVTATSGDEVVSTTTAADGTYELILDLGTWTVTYEADNYATETREVTFDADGQRVVLDVALRSGVASVDPTSIEEILLPGEQRTTDVTLSNTGSAPFDWEAFERGGGTVDGEIEWLQEPQAVPAAQAAQVQRNATTPADQLAGPSAARWAPDTPTPQQARILVYADDFRHLAPNTYVDQALQRLGFAYTAFYDGNFSGFEAALAEGGWDLVIFANENFRPSPTTFDALDAYATGGGKVIALSWAMADFQAHPLWTTLGATFAANDPDPPDPVHWWEADHPLFTDPQSVPELTQLSGGFYLNYGQHVGVLPGFQALGGYTEAPAPDEAALVLGNADRTLFRGFADAQNDADLDADSIPDGVELWENTISGIEQGFFVDVPWLDVDPDAGTVEPGDSQDIAVTIDTTGMEAGVYSAQVVLSTTAVRQPRITIPIRLVVTPYQQGVNVGGTAYTDVSGDDWAADRAFDGSWGYESSSSTVSVRRDIGRTDDDPLYRDARTGQNFNYRFDGLPDGTYQVELHFAEIQRRLPGERLFDVTADTTPLLVGYDIAEDVGQDNAVVQRFTVEVDDGLLRMRFLRRAGSGRPIVNAVRLTNRPDLAAA